MYKKCISLLTLFVFTVFAFSCYSYSKKIIRADKVAAKEGRTAVICAVLTASGEKIEFHKDSWGRIVGDKIVGEVVDESGQSKEVSIPIAEIDLVWVKKFDLGKTIVNSTLVYAGVLTVVIIQWLIGIELGWYESPSCPFVYSFDGEKYIFDAEPFAGSICQGLERTEWCPLQYLQEINGEYRILVTNEVAETEYIDELKLVVVDHPVGVQAVPGALGSIHTFLNPVVPVRAYDREGNDLSLYVCENDWVYWLSRNKEKNPAKKENLRDELIFEFPRPKNVSKVKLLFNGSSTLWGSQALKRYLDLYGNDVYWWYEEIRNFGPAFLKLANMVLREELYTLQIRVETGKGWESKGMIFAGPPLVSENKVYTLDIADVPGDTLRIKLTPPAAFWKINYIAVDYSADLPVKVREMKAFSAVDNTGKDVRTLLTENDNRYLKMPDKGDEVLLIFKAPQRRTGMERTVILKAGGYYDIHLKAQGEPQKALIDRFFSQPGFIVQYAFKEYLLWKKENMEKIK